MPVVRAENNHPAEYRPSVLGIALLWLLSRLPLGWAARLGRAVGSLSYLLDKKRRHIAVVNIALCFPELDAAAQRRLLKQHFRAMGQAVVSTLALGGHRSRERLLRWVSVQRREILDNALAQGKNIILYAPHFVGLEMAWLRLTLERDMVGMYREPRRHLLHWAIDRQRNQFGGIAIASKEGLRPLVRLIRQGLPFYYLPDTDPANLGSYVFAPFCGQSAATLTAPGRIAKLSDAIVIPCIVRQLAPGKGYEISFDEPLAGFPSGDNVADATHMNAVIERHLHSMPEQYMWILRRFKTQPENRLSPYRSPRNPTTPLRS